MSNTQHVWLITGSNRGIGLELTKQLLQSPSNIIVAACRDPSKADALSALAQSNKGRVHIIQLDIADRKSVTDSVQKVTAALGEKGIDYLINNAGVNEAGQDSAFTMDLDVLQHTFLINVAGTAHVSQAYLPLLEKGTKKTIVNVSSSLGSIGFDLGPIYASYSITKTALNMLTYKQAKERPDLTVISMCPGHLKTDLGGPNAPLDVSVGVAGVLKVVHALKPEDSGKFFSHDGALRPW
ncbi:NAD-P-binding protein [Pilatotrama ljubarskyi]|nr:NAD-P-binding protein [Pilatotrama ljubarskyi]